MNEEQDILLWLINNLLTDSQLDAKMPTGETIREWYARFEWSGYGKRGWANREKAVYAHEMERKGWPMAWKPETWVSAHDHNHFINDLIRVKWMDYDVAWNEHAKRSYPEAERDNAAWDYHHEHFIAT